MATATVIFALTYLVLALQRVPRLHIGRPAGALLGAVAMVAFGVLSFDEARDAVDLGLEPAAASMAAAAAVILAGATRPRVALQRVDWSLLLLFGGLFVVMEGLERAGLAEWLVSGVAGPLGHGGPEVLARFGAGVTLLSQAVSNVPAVMLFVTPLETVDTETARKMWLALAAFSTLAGNLTIIASVANLIVFETAEREGVRVGFGEYLRVGFPLTVVTLLLAWCWLAFL